MSAETVSIELSTVKLLHAEIEATHALCDRSMVPRTVNGEKMSFSQRVAILAGAYQGICKKLGMGDFPAEH